MKTLSLATLRKRAQRATAARGHAMQWRAPFGNATSNKYSQFGACRHCGREVLLMQSPAPNGIEIGGEALAIDCDGRTSEVQFFKAHAGYSIGPGETKAQGKARGARALAAAERQARDAGFTFAWTIDPNASSADWIDAGEDGGPDREPWQVWQCAMYNADGALVDSLHSIDFGRDGTPYSEPYKRVVEAELALDGMDNPPQGKGAPIYWRTDTPAAKGTR